MDKQFSKSLSYSILLHVAILLLIYFFYHAFIVVQTPLLMQLTLIGETSQGNSLGSQASQSGQIPEQISKTDNNMKMPTSQNKVMNPSLRNSKRPEVAMKQASKLSSRNNIPSPAQLEQLNNSEPIGLENQNPATTTNIKTTQGVGHEAIMGSPEGNANITGEIASRKLLLQVNPVYPDWAKKQGIEGVVKFQITVLPSGFLKEDDIDLEQTSGYRELDRVVYDALIQWEFAPLAPDVIPENQSGIVTFTFSLKNQS